MLFWGQMGCPETSVRNYHYSLRNDPEERRSHLLRGGILKSRTIIIIVWWVTLTVGAGRAQLV